MSGGSLTGTGSLIRFVLRRDRVRLPVWVLGITVSVIGLVASLPEIFPTEADRQERAAVMDSAAAKVFTGPGHGLDDYTIGAMTANEMGPMTAVAFALMSIFLVVRHTRAEEESGRAELVRAAVVGRHAGAAAALVVVAGAVLLTAALLAIGLPATVTELPASSSALFAASLAGVGLVYAGVAIVAAQAMQHTRGALGVASGALGLTYGVRIVGDIGDGALSWLSPVGWVQATMAYVDDRWWPLLLPLATAAIAVVVAVRLSARRDLGAGLVASRPGRPAAPRSLGGVGGLALRLQRASLVAWTVALFAAGLLFGSIADQAGEFYDDNEAVEEFLERIGAADPADQYLAMSLFIAALVAAAFAVQSVLRLRSEELAARAEPVLAAAVTRWRWVASHVTTALAGIVVLLLAVGLGTGTTRAISVGDAGELPRLVGAALAYAPGLWLIAGAAAALFGLAPRAVPVVWAYVGAAALMGWLGPLLRLPDWAYELSPVEHVPRLPVADLAVAPLVVLTALAAVLTALGVVGFRHRDLA